MPVCKKSETKRKAYTRADGTKVKATCVAKAKKTAKARKTVGKCKSGTIKKKGYMRKAYTRSDGKRVKAVRVKATCVPDKGGKTPKGKRVLPKLRKGELTQYGYSLSEVLVGERRKALKKAIKQYSALSVFRKLNVLSTYMKNSLPAKSKRAKADAKWISKTYLG